MRVEALAKADGMCDVCGFRNLGNDAHHVNYPHNIWETKCEDLVVLCRHCHDSIHNLMAQENAERNKNFLWYNHLRKLILIRENQRVSYAVLKEKNIDRNHHRKNRCILCFVDNPTVSDVQILAKFGRKITWKLCPHCWGLIESSIKRSHSFKEAIRIVRGIKKIKNKELTNRGVKETSQNS